jgi:hypothetical protein
LVGRSVHIGDTPCPYRESGQLAFGKREQTLLQTDVRSITEQRVTPPRSDPVQEPVGCVSQPS